MLFRSNDTATTEIYTLSYTLSLHDALPIFEIDRSGLALRELRAPVVSVFSTGVLEAATVGLPAWVHLPDPPPWVVEFWGRYGLSPWGGAPTAPPARPEMEPSRAVARVVREMMAQ